MILRCIDLRDLPIKGKKFFDMLSIKERTREKEIKSKQGRTVDA